MEKGSTNPEAPEKTKFLSAGMMKSRHSPLHAFIFLLLVISSGYGQKTRIAVCDLTGQGVDQPTAVLVSERLAAWLSQIPAFEVTAPSRVHVLLQERGFSKSCSDDDTACLAEMGKALNDDVVIAGIIARAEGYHTILLRVVDAATGSVLTTGYQDVEAPVEKILSEWTAKAAKQLETVIITKMSNFSVLSIKSNPQGANVVLNGTQAGKTDLLLERYLPGKHTLELSMPTYATVRDTVTLEPKKTLELSYQLKRDKAYSDSIGSVSVRRILIRTALGVLTLACAGAGYYENMQASSAVSAERTAKDNYMKAGTGSDFNRLYDQYQDARKKTDNAITLRNLLYGLSGACTLGFTVSLFF